MPKIDINKMECYNSYAFKIMELFNNLKSSLAFSCKFKCNILYKEVVKKLF